MAFEFNVETNEDEIGVLRLEIGAHMNLPN